jgi:hypothetical protein
MHVPEPLHVRALVRELPLQLWIAPQEYPVGWLADFAQTDRPVEQEIFPISHGLPVSQVALAVHAVQAPL